MGLTYNGVEPDKITYNGQPVDSVTYNGVEVWSGEKTIKVNKSVNTDFIFRSDSQNTNKLMASIWAKINNTLMCFYAKTDTAYFADSTGIMKTVFNGYNVGSTEEITFNVTHNSGGSILSDENGDIYNIGSPYQSTAGSIVKLSGTPSETEANLPLHVDVNVILKNADDTISEYILDISNSGDRLLKLNSSHNNLEVVKTFSHVYQTGRMLGSFIDGNNIFTITHNTTPKDFLILVFDIENQTSALTTIPSNINISYAGVPYCKYIGNKKIICLGYKTLNGSNPDKLNFDLGVLIDLNKNEVSEIPILNPDNMATFAWYDLGNYNMPDNTALYYDKTTDAFCFGTLTT